MAALSAAGSHFPAATGPRSIVYGENEDLGGAARGGA